VTDDRPGGLAPERTRLAWRRTGLALAVGSVAIGRMLQDVIGAAAWVLAVLASVASAVLVGAAYRRSPGSHAGRAGGRLVTVCAVGLLLVALGALVVVVTGGLGGRLLL